MRFNKTKLLSYGIVLSMTAVSMLSTSPLCATAVARSRSHWEFTVSLPIQYVRVAVTAPACISIPARKRLPRECGVRTAPKIVLTLSLSKRAVFN